MNRCFMLILSGSMFSLVCSVGLIVFVEEILFEKLREFRYLLTLEMAVHMAAADNVLGGG